jgi:hypothetical protein
VEQAQCRPAVDDAGAGTGSAEGGDVEPGADGAHEESAFFKKNREEGQETFEEGCEERR